MADANASAKLCAALSDLHSDVAWLMDQANAAKAERASVEAALGDANDRIADLEERLETLTEAQLTAKAEADGLTEVLDARFVELHERLDRMQEDSDKRFAAVAAEAAATAAEAAAKTATAAALPPPPPPPPPKPKPLNPQWAKLKSVKTAMGQARQVHEKHEESNRRSRIDSRLGALEEQLGAIQQRGQSLESLAHSAARSAAEAMKAEFAKQMVSAISASTQASKAEMHAQMSEHQESLAATSKRVAVLEADLLQQLGAVRQQAAASSHAVDDVRSIAEKARDGQQALSHVQKKMREVQAELLEAKASLAAHAKASAEKFETLQETNSKEVDARTTSSEGRLRAEFEATLRAQQERVEQELEQIAAAASKTALDHEIENRFTSLDLKVARKLDAAQEYSRLQQAASEEGPTSQRLHALQRAMGQLQEILMRVEFRDAPGAPEADPTSPRSLKLPTVESQAQLSRQLKLASI